MLGVQPRCGVLESPVGRMGCGVPGRLVRLGDPKCAPAAPTTQPPHCGVHGAEQGPSGAGGTLRLPQVLFGS